MVQLFNSCDHANFAPDALRIVAVAAPESQLFLNHSEFRAFSKHGEFGSVVWFLDLLGL